MTETTHTRSRRAALGGLVLQLVAFAGVLWLSFLTQSQATYSLAWYVLGGVPLWFVALLVFRQRELAALEALDLEELRREKRATGGGEAIFGDEGGMGLAFRVAEARLRWMLQWVVPGFGLATGVYLAGMGVYLWRRLAVTKMPGDTQIVGLRVGEAGWPELQNLPVALVILAIIMLGMFLLSRYASGMSRVREWSLLRGCGSYMLGNAMALVLLMICLGVAVATSAKHVTWEQRLAYVVPAFMVVLAVEVLVSFVLDIYRPRAPGAETRACFDSRLLGLIAEPGGIASSIADAINYQFGFQVSHTWFYQLLARACVPLVAVGAVSLWLLTCIVVVQPYEHAIIERWGRQVNAGGTDAAGHALPAPLGPGLHFKWPWPMDVARAYNTGQLHQISIGWKRFDAIPEYDEEKKPVLLWTDTTHLGQEHFDFVTCRPPLEDGEEKAAVRGTEEGAQASPVYMLRMELAVQYRVAPRELYRYSQAMTDPHKAIRDIAWEELVRFNAASTADYLMGPQLGQIGTTLRARIDERVRPLGLEIVYVGVANVHPEKTVAEAYREVIGAEHQKLAAIREARVIENQRLAEVAGDAWLARTLAKATTRALEADERFNSTTQALQTTGLVEAGFALRLSATIDADRARRRAAAWLDSARAQLAELERPVPEGLAAERTLAEQIAAREEAAQGVTLAEAAVRQAEAAYAAELERLRASLTARQSAAQAEEVVQRLAELIELTPLVRAAVASAAEAADARELAERAEEDYRLGLGETFESQTRARTAAEQAAAAAAAADAAWMQAMAPLRTALATVVGAEGGELLVAAVAGRIGGAHWSDALDGGFSQTRLGGKAAATLAAAAAERWGIEMQQRADLIRVRAELPAYQVAPELYKTRRLVEVLTDGLQNVRKYFLAFDPGERLVRVRFITMDQAGGTSPADWGTKTGP